MNIHAIPFRKYVLVAGLVLLLVFYGFSRWVKRGGLKQADFNTTVKIQERIDRSTRLRLADFVGNVMEGSTFFASPAFTSGVIIVLTLLAAVDVRKKKIRLRTLAIPLFFGLLVLGEIYGKSVVHHPSPPFFMIKNPTSFFPKDYINEQYSYPSGHTARALFLGITALSLAFACFAAKKHRTRYLSLLALCMAIYIGIVAIARIYLGHHWLSDIIGGGLLGGGLGLFTFVGLSFDRR